ncbi:hypothetical protein [Mucilaginibacter jinjuensis]|uniref:SPW repeat-containing protein n=1 Tax=Mucilaginibacter jinjuensis TaxID=1176721 RepID=A0ABY7TGU6_9SPHI|nr:hypothetical protein [Mucilaginibacter jinjuensis]WCT14933.1 hypothetical protein PQO05_13400 [Mucilaginibacter jinjuensis]
MKIKGIKKKHHVYADYTYAPLVFAAPLLAGFSANKPARLTCGVFAFSALSYSLCTKAKWGVVKLIPYRVHAVLDIASGALALVAACLPAIRSDKRARNTFIAMGITGLVVGSLSLIGAQKRKKHIKI